MHIKIIVLYICLVLASCTTFEGEIPVQISAPEMSYISPGIRDGVKDSLPLGLLIPLVRDLYAQGYAIRIHNENGKLVRTITDSAPLNPRRSSIHIPENLSWDGTDGKADMLPDGKYTYYAEVWDRNGNGGRSDSGIVIIDNKAPFAEVSASYLTFSPNGDGRLDTIGIIQHQSTEEDRWEGAIYSKDKSAIRQFSWSGRLPDIVWDGKNSASQTVPSGEYTYQVTSTDRAGNTTVLLLEGILVDLEPKPIVLEISSRIISPNGDRKKDALDFKPALRNPRDVVNWALTVVNDTGVPVREYRGNGALPGSVQFDGKRQDGLRLADGNYRGILEVEFKNGDNPNTASPVFIIDTLPPIASVVVDYSTFSPDGDGRKDSLIINQSTSPERRWFGRILDANGGVVRAFEWEKHAIRINWDSTDAANRKVPDGVYSYELSSSDEGDNSTTVTIKDIRIDTRAPTATATPSAIAISPNGDGLHDTVAFTVRASFGEEIESWKFRIVDDRNVEYRVYEGTAGVRIPQSIVWDGRNNSGAVREGAFRSEVTVNYRKGNQLLVRGREVLKIDVTGPSIFADVEPGVFSPDGDGTDDTAVITITSSDPSGVANWITRVIDSRKILFRRFAGQGTPRERIIWDGTSNIGELVQSFDEYEIVIEAYDTLGNVSTAKKLIQTDVLVLKTGYRYKIVVTGISFTPLTANYRDVSRANIDKNTKIFDRISEILRKYPDYKARIEGHTVVTAWQNPKARQAEEDEILLPLSIARAEAVKEALVERGISAERLSVEGFGGTHPLVPHSDRVNSWKNRRVEIMLVS